MNDQFKSINYRGILSFRIPASWMEEYEETGGGIFYLDQPDSATLAVNVLTFESSGIFENVSAEDFIKSRMKDINTELNLLDNRNASITYWKHAGEAGNELAIKYWEIANIVQPNHIRIAIFSYTLLKKQTQDKYYLDEINLLNQEILSCKFSTSMGISKTK
jgi:hypothetical protein